MLRLSFTFNEKKKLRKKTCREMSSMVKTKACFIGTRRRKKKYQIDSCSVHFISIYSFSLRSVFQHFNILLWHKKLYWYPTNEDVKRANSFLSIYTFSPEGKISIAKSEEKKIMIRSGPQLFEQSLMSGRWQLPM